MVSKNGLKKWSQQSGTFAGFLLSDKTITKVASLLSDVSLREEGFCKGEIPDDFIEDNILCHVCRVIARYCIV